MSLWNTLKRLLKNSRRKKRFFHFLTPTLDLELYSTTHWKDERKQFWDSLSAREHDVTALTCLGFTNSQIASRLDISTETVKSYLTKVLNKSGLRSKADLRVYFAGWHFSLWDQQRNPYR